MTEPRVRVKFCGMRRREDIEHAVRLGADYVGFVFVPGSPRALQIDDAAGSLAGIDWGHTQRVGVFQDQPADHVRDVVRRLGLDLVQLHGREPLDYMRLLGLPVLQVVCVPAGPVAPEYVSTPNVFGVLFDAVDASGRSGGLGLQVDAATLSRAIATAETRVFIAGGLTPANVAGIVQRFRPWGVDVSSGIESQPGIKDHTQMVAFLNAARQVRGPGGKRRSAR